MELDPDFGPTFRTAAGSHPRTLSTPEPTALVPSGDTTGSCRTLDGIVLDTSDDMCGELIFTVFAAIAKFQRQQIVAVTAGANQGSYAIPFTLTTSNGTALGKTYVRLYAMHVFSIGFGTGGTGLAGTGPVASSGITGKCATDAGDVNANANPIPPRPGSRAPALWSTRHQDCAWTTRAPRLPTGHSCRSTTATNPAHSCGAKARQPTMR